MMNLFSIVHANWDNKEFISAKLPVWCSVVSLLLDAPRRNTTKMKILCMMDDMKWNKKIFTPSGTTVWYMSTHVDEWRESERKKKLSSKYLSVSHTVKSNNGSPNSAYANSANQAIFVWCTKDTKLTCQHSFLPAQKTSWHLAALLAWVMDRKNNNMI